MICHAGKARVKDCLEDHREDPIFNAECKAELEKMMEHRATDFRLDSNLRDLCASDIDEMCGYQRVGTSPWPRCTGPAQEVLGLWHQTFQPCCRLQAKYLCHL